MSAGWLLAGGDADRLLSIENFIGGSGNDTIVGDSGGNARFGATMTRKPFDSVRCEAAGMRAFTGVPAAGGCSR